jgi:hypothetical protein
MIEYYNIRNSKTRILLLLVLILVVLYLINKRENYAGALTQLYAKGPQDYYLTGYPTYYNPYYYRYPYYYPYVWNMPTRINRNQAPYLLLTGDRYYLY